MNKTAARILLALATAFSLVSGCQCDRHNPEKTGYNRVLILYSAGYNSLRDYLYEDIQDLKKGYAPGIRDSRAFLVVSHLSVRRGDYSTETSPQLIRVYSDKKKGVVLDTLKSYTGDLSDKSTMNIILSDIKRQFPSEHYGMVFSSHATGWMPVGYYNNPGSYEPSYSGGRKGSAPISLPDGAYPYIEPELLPGEPLTKSLTLTNGTKTATEMEMTFQEGILTEGVMRTSHGDFDLKMETFNILFFPETADEETTIDGREYCVKKAMLEYDLRFPNQDPMRNTMFFKVHLAK